MREEHFPSQSTWWSKPGSEPKVKGPHYIPASSQQPTAAPTYFDGTAAGSTNLSQSAPPRPAPSVPYHGQLHSAPFQTSFIPSHPSHRTRPLLQGWSTNGQSAQPFASDRPPRPPPMGWNGSQCMPPPPAPVWAQPISSGSMGHHSTRVVPMRPPPFEPMSLSHDAWSSTAKSLSEIRSLRQQLTSAEKDRDEYKAQLMRSKQAREVIKLGHAVESATKDRTIEVLENDLQVIVDRWVRSILSKEPYEYEKGDEDGPCDCSDCLSKQNSRRDSDDTASDRSD